MNKLFPQLNTFFRRLEDANGEQEITPIMQEWNTWLNSLSGQEKERANAEFSYHLTKRFIKAEEKVQKVKAEMTKSIL